MINSRLCRCMEKKNWVLALYGQSKSNEVLRNKEGGNMFEYSVELKKDANGTYQVSFPDCRV